MSFFDEFDPLGAPQAAAPAPRAKKSKKPAPPPSSSDDSDSEPTPPPRKAKKKVVAPPPEPEPEPLPVPVVKKKKKHVPEPEPESEESEEEVAPPPRKVKKAVPAPAPVVVEPPVVVKKVAKKKPVVVSSSSESSDSSDSSDSDQEGKPPRRKAKAAAAPVKKAAKQPAPTIVDPQLFAAFDFTGSGSPQPAAAASAPAARRKPAPQPVDDDDDTGTDSDAPPPPKKASKKSAPAPAPEAASSSQRTCSVAECGAPRVKRGYCATHANDPSAPVAATTMASFLGDETDEALEGFNDLEVAPTRRGQPAAAAGGARKRPVQRDQGLDDEEDVAPVVPASAGVGGARKKSPKDWRIDFENTSTSLGMNKNIVTWNFIWKRAPHSVELHHSTFGGKRKVLVDDRVRVQEKKPFADASRYDMRIGEGPLSVNIAVQIKAAGLTAFTYELFIEKQPYDLAQKYWLSHPEA